jgi:hypothetical protein
MTLGKFYSDKEKLTFDEQNPLNISQRKEESENKLKENNFKSRIQTKSNQLLN